METQEWPNLLTVREVAEMMRVSKMTVYRLIDSGDLRAKRIGRGFRIPEKAVVDYLNSVDTAELVIAE
jgi:excisionase family DNA binding protein